jgi:NAD+ diphosphatase
MTMTELVPGFSVNTIDRSDEVRSNPEMLASWFDDPAAQCLMLDGLDPRIEGDRIARQPIPPGAAIAGYALLGKGEDGRPLFVLLQSGLSHGAIFPAELRAAIADLSPNELGLYAGARSLLDWHARHGFCANCGAGTNPAKGGWSRTCISCTAEHFPRVDPVVIMLAEHDGRVLLGRQPRFPERRYSALAGFVEPGETIEGAVARELYEEAGVTVSSVQYVMSQPWPFPSSLMIACTAVAVSDQLRIDETELEDAFWATADDVRAAFAGEESALFLSPPSMAVAHHLLRHWLDAKDGRAG